MSSDTTTIATQKVFAAVFGLIIAGLGLEGVACWLSVFSRPGLCMWIKSLSQAALLGRKRLLPKRR